MTDGEKTIVAMLNDLMFTVKIQDAAKRAGFKPVFVKTREEAMARAREHPAALILDLNYPAGDPLGTIEALKADPETDHVPLLGFVSHVQTDIIKAAQNKGCESVLARSAFSQNLPTILERYAAG